MLPLQTDSYYPALYSVLLSQIPPPDSVWCQRTTAARSWSDVTQITLFWHIYELHLHVRPCTCTVVPVLTRLLLYLHVCRGTWPHSPFRCTNSSLSTGCPGQQQPIQAAGLTTESLLTFITGIVGTNKTNSYKRSI